MSAKKLTIVNLVHRDFEDLELWYPVLRLREEEITVVIAGEKAGKTYKGKHGVPVEADIGFQALDTDNVDGLLIPGGWAPDKLRRDNDVLNFIRNLDKQEKPIGEICHAGWVLVSADILQGRKVTSTPAIKDDMRNAGAKWVDEPVVIDKNLVSSRRPPDLPVYMKTYIEVLKNFYK
ncbi:MAG: type 1 glutamine amidotransferase domain-containing protein [Bacteroidales bacterium]